MITRRAFLLSSTAVAAVAAVPAITALPHGRTGVWCCDDPRFLWENALNRELSLPERREWLEAIIADERAWDLAMEFQAGLGWTDDMIVLSTKHEHHWLPRS